MAVGMDGGNIWACHHPSPSLLMPSFFLFITTLNFTITNCDTDVNGTLKILLPDWLVTCLHFRTPLSFLFVWTSSFSYINHGFFSRLSVLREALTCGCKSSLVFPCRHANALETAWSVNSSWTTARGHTQGHIHVRFVTERDRLEEVTLRGQKAEKVSQERRPDKMGQWC